MTVERAPTNPGDASPLKIALLGYRSNPYSGGQGIYLHYLSKALQAAGHSVDVISGPPYPDLVPGVRLIKLPSLDLYNEPNHVTALRPKHLTSLTDTFEYFSMLTGGFPEPYTFGRRLIKYFNEARPDYDIIHDNQSLCYGALQLQRRGYPLVTTIHHPVTSDRELALASATTARQRLLIRRWHAFIGMQKTVVKQLRHIVTVSEVSAHDVAEAFGLNQGRLNVIHNGIDTVTFSPRPDVQRVPLRIMATASADQPLKGLAYLLRAIAGLVPQYPDIHLVVVGKLKEDGATNRLIDELGIRSRLRFVSGVETEEIVRLYAEASIVVVPSIYEGFGFPAGEAMACCVPVISTDGGALPEVVGEAGITVPVRDSQAIADNIAHLIENPEERSRLARAGRERIEARFSWQVAADKMIDFYRDVINLETTA
ncbi:MAG: glycosyltransferase family 4 protein [Gammaproteobacteria bacterium]|nr:glycosyltransferase family 4 protein [Gammaproteobacteria bacterium]